MIEGPIPKDGEPDNRFYQFPSPDIGGYGQPSFTREVYCPYCGQKLKVNFYPELSAFREKTGAHYVSVHHCDSTFDLRTTVKRDKQAEKWEEERKRRSN